MRKLSALLAAVVVLPVLAACSGPLGGCDAPFTSGDASSVVEATGKLGSKPTITMPTPIVANQTEVSTLVEGDGSRVKSGQPVLAEVSILNGTTGEVLQSTGFAGEGSGIILTVGTETLPPLTIALECASVGSRVIVAGSAEETHGGKAVPEAGIAADDSFIYVVDILDSYLAKANGKTRAGDNGDPTVVLAPNGTPGVSMPQTDAPEELKTSVLKQGDGDTVAEGDHVVVHYSGFTWADNKMFDSTWDDGGAVTLELAEGALVPGFLQGIVGQKVGSQVLVVIPPELGYGEQSQNGIPAGSTLVFVVDLLGIAE